MMTGKRWAIVGVALLILSMGSIAAEVEYRHPNLTIVATDEPLDSVLKSVSREMRIFVTVPTGLNPSVNCDIRDLPVKQAFKKLLGDMSYSLEWRDNGEQLVGLTILAGSGESVAGTQAGSQSTVPREEPTTAASVASGGNQAASAPVAPGRDATHTPVSDPEMAARQEEHEALMAEERAEREAEMELRREEERVAHEARMAEEELRNEAEMAEYFESQGIDPGH
jgi:hypothetical protein